MEEITVENDAFVTMWYPDMKEPFTIWVDLCHVRAASPIGIRYDFERDGYSIIQGPVIQRESWAEPAGDDEEVAFVPAWLEVSGED